MNILEKIIANIKKIASLNRMDWNIHELEEHVKRCEKQNEELTKVILFYRKENSELLERLAAIESNLDEHSDRINKQLSQINRQADQINRQADQINKNEQRNIKNHEKYSDAIAELRKKNNKINLFISEENERQEYEYNQSLSPDRYEQELTDWFKRKTGKKLNLAAPKTWNEKINWMKLYDSTGLKTKLADKYEVRQWVAEKIGEQYLVPLIGVWENFDDINFDLLPDQFVLKCNHGSGMNIIVDNKEEFDISAARRKMNKWLNTNFAYTAGLELHYKDIKPLIIAEQYLADDGELNDFKIMCFHGEPKYIWVDYDRKTNHTRDMFDTEWNLQPFRIGYHNSDKKKERPENLNELLQIAKILSQGFSFVRVDLYNLNGKIYFGEMTFTSGNGAKTVEPEDYDRILGDGINLSMNKL